MPLTVLNNALLRVGNALASACCCDFWCNLITDKCGNEFYSCGKKGAGTVGLCTDECGPPPPTDECKCGPTLQCGECEECVDRKCQKIRDCCRDATGCGACTQCIDNRCEPCGPCETCTDGACVPCPYGCTGGVCEPPPPPPPSLCYCCYDEDPTAGGSNEMIGTHCQSTPCAAGLNKSGPYPCSECADDCQRYSCADVGCGERKCQKDAEGRYTTESDCKKSCVDDDCNAPCLFATREAPGTFEIDACKRDICVSFSSLNSKPIRVQIWGPTLDENCNEVASRVIKRDSEWRCDECCDCPAVAPRSNDPRKCQGGPSGTLSWTKPTGVTRFEVQVLAACGAEYSIQVRACEDCTARQEPANCGCEEDGDCPDHIASGCKCCRGKCIKTDNCPGCTTEQCQQELQEWYKDYFSPTDPNTGDSLLPDCDTYADEGPFGSLEECGVSASSHPECNSTCNGGAVGECCASSGECYIPRDERCPP